MFTKRWWTIHWKEISPVDSIIRLINRDHKRRMHWFWLMQKHCFGCLWVGLPLTSFSATCMSNIWYASPSSSNTGKNSRNRRKLIYLVESNIYYFFLLIFWWIISLRFEKILFCLGLFLIIKHSQCSPVKQEVKGLQGSEWLESRKIPTDAMDTKQPTGTFTHFSSAL